MIYPIRIAALVQYDLEADNFEEADELAARLFLSSIIENPDNVIKHLDIQILSIEEEN